MPPESDYNKGQKLVEAVVANNAEVVLDYLRRGADIHFREDRAFLSAFYLGNMEMMELLLAKGANVHAQKEEALFCAIKADDGKLIDLLLEYGANPEAVLKKRKDELDAGDLNVIDRLMSRDSKERTERNLEAFRKKARSPGLKPKL